MSGGTAARLVAACAVVVTGVLWYRGGGVLAAVGNIVSVGVFLGAVVTAVRSKLDESERLTLAQTAALSGVVIALVLAVTLVPASLVDRGRGAAQPSPSAPEEPATASTSAPASPTPDPVVGRYCELAVEFLAHAQQFSGKGWQGKITKRDFDPIVRTANAALRTAPQEMRAPMTVLASSYSAAQDGWSDDNMLENVGLAVGTILSPSARTASDAVDAYENEHCF